MQKYLIPCACGRQLAVEAGQAGESLLCECGTTVVVPTLRQLRTLPAVREEVRAASGRSWGFRQGAMTVSLLVATACLVIAGASRYSEAPVPAIDPAAYAQKVDRL